MPTRLENWMADIRDEALLKEVVIPATHDAGMVKKFCSKGALSKDNYSTQLLTVGDQVRVGVRQLDLRISAHGAVLKAFHGGEDAGTDMQSRLGLRAYGESWEDICRGLATFIQEHPSELVILKMDKQDAHTSDVMRVMLRVVNEVCNTPLPPLNLAGTLDLSECPLGRLRGRLFVCGSGHAVQAGAACLRRILGGYLQGAGNFHSGTPERTRYSENGQTGRAHHGPYARHAEGRERGL